MVRLLPGQDYRTIWRGICFNPTMVRLLPAGYALANSPHKVSFNPTMVRLLHPLAHPNQHPL